MIQHLIWDAGGTLFDTYPAVVEAAQQTLATFGQDARADWLMRLFRTTTDQALHTLSATFELLEPELRRRFGQHYDAMGPELQPPFPHVREVCEFVCEHGGRNFIVTHRAWSSLEGLLAAHRMGHYFDDFITGDDPYPRKPDPTSLSVLLARHSLAPGRCMLVGDRALDLEAGRSAGVSTCYFGAETLDASVDLAISDYSALLHWLTQQYRVGD